METNKYYSPEQIDYELDHSGRFPEYARSVLAKALSYLPEGVVDFIVKNYVFLSLDKETKGEHWSFEDFRLKGKEGFILFGSSLWDEKPIQIAFVVAHEVAHAFKNHKFKSFEDTEANRGTERENEADELAIQWLSPFFKLEDLKKLKYKKWQLE